jgi:hypothetical protein
LKDKRESRRKHCIKNDFKKLRNLDSKKKNKLKSNRKSKDLQMKQPQHPPQLLIPPLPTPTKKN